MIEKIKNLLLILILISLNIFFIPRAIDFSRIYPFQRIAVDGVLLHGISVQGGGYSFKSKIISIQGVEVDRNNLVGVLESVRNERVISVAVIHNGEIDRREIVKQDYNEDIIWLFLLLLLLANIHYIWGFLIKTIRSNISQSMLFFYISAGLSIFHFLLIEFLSYNELQLLLSAVVIYIIYLILSIGYNLLNKKMTNRSIVFFFLMIFMSIVLFNIFTAGKLKGSTFTFLSILLIVGSIFSLVKTLFNLIVSRNIYILKRGLIIASVILIGVVMPITFLMLGLYYDLRVPAQCYPILSVIIPLVAGNGLLQYDIFSSRMFLGTGFTQFFLNMLISIIAASFLFYISNSVTSVYQMITLYSIFAVLTIFLLHFKRILRRKLNNALFINKDEYAFSLQNIAELVSLPEDISVKIKRIFNEIIRLTDVGYLRLVFFGDRVDEHYNNLKGHVEYLQEDSSLFTFFMRNRGLIFRYSLIKNSLNEERVYQFLEKRGIILAIPIFREKELIGALLVGDKIRDNALSISDIKYLETVSFQLQQLLDNDRLLKDYITRSSFEKELEIASNIQIRLFPQKAPERRGLAISFYNRPYLKVTGDYFDFIKVDRDCTAIVIGDISGHGLAAAMVLSMTSSITNAMLKEKKSIERTLLEINHFLNYRYKGIELISLFIGIFNKRTREMTYINAGHCAPILIKGGLSVLEGRSKILGADPSARYFSSKFTLNRGDELLFYTDGVIEIYDEKNNELFSEKNLLEIISKNINLDPEGKVNAVIKSINKFDVETLKDDITLIGVKIL